MKTVRTEGKVQGGKNREDRWGRIRGGGRVGKRLKTSRRRRRRRTRRRRRGRRGRRKKSKRKIPPLYNRGLRQR